MAGQHQVSLKRIQINKANTIMVASIAVAAFIVVFSLVASRALLSKRGYQSRVIDGKTTAVNQLEQNLDTVDELVVSYQAFVGTPDNVIGGNPSGSGEGDGDNAKIVLDALPSKYDFPALATSLEKILGKKYQIDGITGTDDEVAQGNGTVTAPAPVDMPFEVGATGNFTSIKDLLLIFERSIRPIKISKLEVNGSNSQLQITVNAKTYYQPEKTLSVQKKVVK